MLLPISTPLSPKSSRSRGNMAAAAPGSLSGTAPRPLNRVGAAAIISAIWTLLCMQTISAAAGSSQ